MEVRNEELFKVKIFPYSIIGVMSFIFLGSLGPMASYRKESWMVSVWGKVKINLIVKRGVMKCYARSVLLYVMDLLYELKAFEM